MPPIIDPNIRFGSVHSSNPRQMPSQPQLKIISDYWWVRMCFVVGNRPSHSRTRTRYIKWLGSPISSKVYGDIVADVGIWSGNSGDGEKCYCYTRTYIVWPSIGFSEIAPDRWCLSIGNPNRFAIRAHREKGKTGVQTCQAKRAICLKHSNWLALEFRPKYGKMENSQRLMNCSLELKCAQKR